MSAMAGIAYRLISLSHRIASTHGPDLSYRIASLAESDCSYRVLSYGGHECELSYRIVSRPESTPTYRIVLVARIRTRTRDGGRVRLGPQGLGAWAGLRLGFRLGPAMDLL